MKKAGFVSLLPVRRILFRFGAYGFQPSCSLVVSGCGTFGSWVCKCWVWESRNRGKLWQTVQRCSNRFMHVTLLDPPEGVFHINGHKSLPIAWVSWFEWVQATSFRPKFWFVQRPRRHTNFRHVLRVFMPCLFWHTWDACNAHEDLICQPGINCNTKACGVTMHFAEWTILTSLSHVTFLAQTIVNVPWWSLDSMNYLFWFSFFLHWHGFLQKTQIPTKTSKHIFCRQTHAFGTYNLTSISATQDSWVSNPSNIWVLAKAQNLK